MRWMRVYAPQSSEFFSRMNTIVVLLILAGRVRYSNLMCSAHIVCLLLPRLWHFQKVVCSRLEIYTFWVVELWFSGMTRVCSLLWWSRKHRGNEKWTKIYELKFERKMCVLKIFRDRKIFAILCIMGRFECLKRSPVSLSCYFFLYSKVEDV